MYTLRTFYSFFFKLLFYTIIQNSLVLPLKYNESIINTRTFLCIERKDCRNITISIPLKPKPKLQYCIDIVTLKKVIADLNELKTKIKSHTSRKLIFNYKSNINSF